MVRTTHPVIPDIEGYTCGQIEYDIVVEGKADADITLENEVIWYTGRLWVPDIVDLSMIILPEEYDSKVAGHICQEKTTELVWRNFF
jgi:hypothetical protein